MFNPGMKIYKTNLPYTLSEDLEILRYIKANYLHYDIKGEKIWREMEKHKEFFRSSTGLKNHFNVIMRNIHSLKYRSVLTQKDVCDLLDSWSETPSELKAALYRQRSASENRTSILRRFSDDPYILELNPKSLRSFINYQRYAQFKPSKRTIPNTNRDELEKLETIIEKNKTPSIESLSLTEKLIRKYAHISSKSKIDEINNKRIEDYVNKCHDYLENHERKSQTISIENRSQVINENIPIIDLTLENDEYTHTTAATCTVHSRNNRSTDFQNVSSNYVNNFIEPEIIITEESNRVKLQQSIQSNKATVYSNSLKSTISIKSERRKTQSISMNYTKNISLLLNNATQMKKLSYQESFKTTSNRSSYVNVSEKAPILSSDKSVNDKNDTTVKKSIEILENRLITHRKKCSIFCQSSEEQMMLNNFKQLESNFEKSKCVENNELQLVDNISNLTIDSNVENKQNSNENPINVEKNENELQSVSHEKLNATQKESSLPAYYEKSSPLKPRKEFNILAETRTFTEIPHHNDNVDDDLRENLSNGVSQQILSLKKALNKFPLRKITPFYNRNDKNMAHKRKRGKMDDITPNSLSSENDLSQPITWEYEDECIEKPKRICYNRTEEKLEKESSTLKDYQKNYKNDSGCLIGSNSKQKSNSVKSLKNSLISSDESSFSWDVDNDLIGNQKKSIEKESKSEQNAVEAIDISQKKIMEKFGCEDLGEFLLDHDYGHKSQISQYLKN